MDTNLDTIIGAGTLVNIKHRKKVTNKKQMNKGPVVQRRSSKMFPLNLTIQRYFLSSSFKLTPIKGGFGLGVLGWVQGVLLVHRVKRGGNW